MKSHIIDIEVYGNLFLLGVKDFKEKKVFTFEVSERIDQREALYEYLMTYDGYFISFNGLYYDEVVLKYFIKDYEKLKVLSVDKFLKNIKNFSNHTIASSEVPSSFEVIKWYKWYKKVNWTSIDLYCYWSKMLRMSKKISLKSLAIQLNHDHIQELPYEHTKILTLGEIEEVVKYNTNNDLVITEKLFVKMKEEVLLRRYIEKEYDLPCYSMDAPKIASELLIKDYCEQTYDPSEFNTIEDYVRDFKSRRYEPYSGIIRDIMGDFKVEFEIPQFQEFYERIMSGDRTFSDEFILIHEPSQTKVICSFGIGGAHSLQTNEYFVSNKYQIITSDYASLYPNIIINWKCIRFPETLQKYIGVKVDRLVAKKEKNKTKDKLLKLILNSLSGLLDNSHSPLYYPEGALRMRVIGQLILTKTAEIVMLNGGRVISLNTDGLEAIIPKENEEKYKNDLKAAEQMFNIDLEHEKYSKIIYSNVNNYVAVSESGKIKKKGIFKYHDDIPLGDSVNEQVIAIALEKYFVEGIPVEEVICKPWNHGLHIYDYCVSKKIGKDYDVIYNNEKQQQLNRYYFSKSGSYLYKLKKTGKKVTGNPQHIHSDAGVILFNKFVDKPWEDYEIDYHYYIAKTRKLINDMEKNIREGNLFADLGF